MIPLDFSGLELLKDRPLAPGHRLYVVGAAGRKNRKLYGSQAWCSCGIRLASSSREQFQRAIDGAARSHGSELALGHYGLSRMLEELRHDLAGLTIEEILDDYGTPRPISASFVDELRSRLDESLAERLWTEHPSSSPDIPTEPRRRRTPRRRVAS